MANEKQLVGLCMFIFTYMIVYIYDFIYCTWVCVSELVVFANVCHSG